MSDYTGIIGLILDAFKGGGNSNSGPKTTSDYRSIAKQASHGVCQFPVITTRSLDYDTSMMISKACERSFSSFLQVVLQMNQVMGSDEQVKDFIARFHTNSNDVEEMLESVSPRAREIVKQLLEDQSLVFEDQFESKSLNERYNPKDAKVVFSGKYMKESFGSKLITPVAEAKANTDDPKYIGDYVPKDLLKDNDVKKANEIVPSLLHIRVKQATANGVLPIDFIIGVKATLHPVTANDMIFNMTKSITDKGKVFNFLRWTTGELSLVKDLILGLGETKENLKAQYDKKASAWWNLLRNRKILARLSKWGRSNPILPNATIVISQEEADYIKANSHFDFLDADNAKKVMNDLGLIQFVIVDPSTEVAHFLIDGQKDFETYTFNSIERENGNSQRQFKEMLKLAGKL